MNIFQQSKLILHDKRGVAALLTVVMISAAVLIMAFSVSVLSIGELNMGYTAQKGEEALAFAQGCAEEGLRRLGIDSNWNGGTLNLFDGSCIISLVSNGSDRTMMVVGNVGNYQKKIRILAKVNSGIVTVSSWQEYSD